MPIEFRCTQCSRLLRTPDGTAGKQARCPECGAVTTIPAAAPSRSRSEPAGAPVSPSPPKPSLAETSPYPGPAGRSISAESTRRRHRLPGDRYQALLSTLTPTRIDMWEVFSRTWSVFQRHWGNCLLAMALVAGAALGILGVCQIGSAIVAFLIRDLTLAFIAGCLIWLAAGLCCLWLIIGLNLYFLKLARGQRAELSDLFSGGPYLLPILAASLLYSVICGVGHMICFIPGIILMLMFSQYYFLILDRNVGPFEALGLSADITKGNKLALLAINLAVSLGSFVSVIGAIMLVVFGTAPISILIVGLLFLAVLPFVVLLKPVIYLSMTGQWRAARLATPGPLR